MKDGYKLLVLFDPHLQTIPAPGYSQGWKPSSSRALETALKFGEYWCPDETIIGHDFMEFGPISYWNQRRRLEMEGRRLLYDFEYANHILDRICNFTSSKIVFQPGNHDWWLDQYIQERPELEGLINQDKMLKFSERGIVELKYGLPYRVGKAAFSHSLLNNRKTFNTKYHASRIAEDYGRSIFYGHFHTHQVFTRVTYDSKPNTAVGIGCLSNLNPGWLRFSPNAWVNQLLFMEFDKQGHFTYYCPIMIDGKFMYNEKVFGLAK
jgi:hypothetical protein